MGFGICAAFGLGLVPGGRYPTAIIGDGSFLMQAQAVRDMVKHKPNCTIVVLDNQAMGAITALQWAQEYEGFATVDPTPLQPVDYAMLARSMGCRAYTPRANTDSLTDALDQAFRQEGPAGYRRESASRPGGIRCTGSVWPLERWSLVGASREDLGR